MEEFVKEEMFCEKHFEFGDDEETLVSNFQKALNLFSEAYKQTAVFAEYAEDGEVFSSEEAAESFESLALSFKFCLMFIEELNMGLQMKVVKEAKEDSLQAYINNVMRCLTE